jgi:hypothetical protein
MLIIVGLSAGAALLWGWAVARQHKGGKPVGCRLAEALS